MDRKSEMNRLINEIADLLVDELGIVDQQFISEELHLPHTDVEILSAIDAGETSLDGFALDAIQHARITNMRAACRRLVSVDVAEQCLINILGSDPATLARLILIREDHASNPLCTKMQDTLAETYVYGV
jgi:hypothetical protein